MSLKMELDTLDGLDASIAGLYEDAGGKFRLKVEGVEDVSGLKKKVAELLDETKAEREKRKALEDAQRKADEDRAKEKGEFKKLYEDTLADLKKEQESNALFQQRIREKEVQASAQAIAGELARKDGKRAAVLAEYAAKLAEYGEDGAVKFKMGGMDATPEQIKEHLAKEYPFLVDGSDATGGGAAGMKGGTTGEDWHKLSPVERLNAARAGGKK